MPSMIPLEQPFTVSRGVMIGEFSYDFVQKLKIFNRILIIINNNFTTLELEISVGPRNAKLSIFSPIC